MNKNCINMSEFNYKCPCSELPLDKLHILKGGNCIKTQGDCFGTREQLGSSPSCNKKIDNYYSQSDKSFGNRYSAYGGNKEISSYEKTTIGNLFKNTGKMKDIVIHSFDDKFYTEGFIGIDSKKKLNNLKKFLIKNGIKKNFINVGKYSTGGINLRYSKKKKGGGMGYYLSVEKCPINGLSEIVKYNTDNYPIFKGSLLNGGKKTKKKKKKGGDAKCSNFSANLCSRTFDCKQPAWDPKCI